MQVKSTNKYFPVRLKYLRESNRLKGYELARLIGVSQSVIWKWESGRNFPLQKTIVKIANFFGVSVDFLLGNDEITINATSFTVYSPKWSKLTESERDLIVKNTINLIEQFYNSKKGD